MFPPTFLYTQSWEDPRPDAKVRFSLILVIPPESSLAPNVSVLESCP